MKNTPPATALVPPGVVTRTGPLWAPAGTATPVRLVPAAFTTKPPVTVLTPALPVKAMLLAPARLVPDRLMTVPGRPMAGATAVRVGDVWA